MSGGSSTNNSWTILTPEETAAETLRPLAEGTEHHEASAPSAAGCGESPATAGAESAERLPAEGHLVSEGPAAELIGGRSSEAPSSVPDVSVPASLDVSGALSQSEGLPEGSAQSSPEPESFTDSYTHVTASPDEAPASLLTAETLGAEDVSQEEEELPQDGEKLPKDGEQLPVNGAGLQLDEESELSRMTPDVGKQAEAPDSEAGEEPAEKTVEEGEAELRRRSLLAALERIGRMEEEEEEEEDAAEEEEFQVPRRDDESGFSVNKCILGAVILLGLGTIFFSGVFMDLDEESDYATRELKDAELPGKQEWLNQEAPPPAPVDADSTELLNKLASGSQQISVLQAQLQAQKEELKVAKGQAAEGAKERLRWEEMEKEYSRLKKEMASLPVLQKENERMKRELESVPALQRELETLRMKLSAAAPETPQPPVEPETPPPGGQPEESRQSGAAPTESQPRKPWDDQRDRKKDMGVRKEWKETSEGKEGEKRERKDGGKQEWKKEKIDKEMKQKSDESKHRKEKDWKSEKASRGDEGKPWKDREGKKDRIEKSERKEWKEEKEWKKAKHEKVGEGKQWKSKDEQRSWKVGKDGKQAGGEEWKGEKEWKKGKDGHKESGREKWEKKDWKEKGERKEWKSKDGKEGKWKGEKKQWEEGRNNGRDGKWKDERRQRAENEGWKGKSKDDGEWKRKQRKESEWKGKDGRGDNEGRRKDEKNEEHWKKERRDRKHDGDRKDAHRYSGGHQGDRKPAHTHRRAAPQQQQPDFWLQQRQRLQRNPKPTVLLCNSVESCAQAEGLLPVPYPEFSAFLQTYLAKAEQAGVDASRRDELQKLAAEFFRDGVFAHDQMSFQDFAEDLSDVLEDMVEGDEEEEEEDSAVEDEMEAFEKEVLKRFSAPGGGEKERRSKGEWRKESVRGRG